MDEQQKDLKGEDRSSEQDPISRNAGIDDPLARDRVAEQMDKFLSFDELAGEEDSLDLDHLARQQNHPFANYPVRLIKQRIYPANPILEHLSAVGLAEYCLVRNITHPTKMTIETFPDPANKNVMKRKVSKCTMKAEDIRAWIEEKETLTFPSYAIVFCEYRRKRSVPHSRLVKSYVDNRNYDVVFDKRWKLPNGQHRKGYFAIVEDHTVRSQLLYHFHPKKRGKLVIDKRYSFLKKDNQQLQPLKDVFMIIQKNRKAIIEAGIASSGDQAEKELMGEATISV